MFDLLREIARSKPQTLRLQRFNQHFARPPMKFFGIFKLSGVIIKGKYHLRFQRHRLLQMEFVQLLLVGFISGDNYRPRLHVARAGTAQAGIQNTVMQIVVNILAGK